MQPTLLVLWTKRVTTKPNDMSHISSGTNTALDVVPVVSERRSEIDRSTNVISLVFDAEVSIIEPSSIKAVPYHFHPLHMPVTYPNLKSMSFSVFTWIAFRGDFQTKILDEIFGFH